MNQLVIWLCNEYFQEEHKKCSLLYLLDFILFTGLFQGNASNEFGSCCKVYVKMPDVLIHGNLDLGSFFPPLLLSK